MYQSELAIPMAAINRCAMHGQVVDMVVSRKVVFAVGATDRVVAWTPDNP